MSKFARRFLLLFVLVVGISAAVIYTTVDINTLHNLTRFHSWSLLLALIAVGFGMFFDGDECTSSKSPMKKSPCTRRFR